MCFFIILAIKLLYLVGHLIVLDLVFQLPLTVLAEVCDVSANVAVFIAGIFEFQSNEIVLVDLWIDRKFIRVNFT